MTIYFPNEPRDFDSDFQALATAGPWMPFLEAFYNAQAGVVLQTDVGFAAETLTWRRWSTIRAGTRSPSR